MATIKVLAGNFVKGNSSFSNGRFKLVIDGTVADVKIISVNKIETIEQASEENVKRIGGTAGWGLAGAVALGGVGLLAGLILGGKGKDITFVILFKDQRKLLASTDSKTFSLIKSEYLDSTTSSKYDYGIQVPDSVKNANNSAFNSYSAGFIEDKPKGFIDKVAKFIGLLIKTSFILIIVFLFFTAIAVNFF